MKCKKIVSGLLAFALVATSVFTGDLATVKAAEMPTPIATYGFNASEDGAYDPGQAIGYKTGADGAGTIEYAKGRSENENDYAIKTDQVGVKLAEKNLGTQCTLSMWVKPTGYIRNFGPILWFGEGEIGKWAALAGAWEGEEGKYTESGTKEQYLIWGGDASKVPEIQYEMDLNQWTMLTCVQDGSDITVYKNGQALGISHIADGISIMDGENRVVYAGVNPYKADGTFPGVIDDISVYNTSLTAAQVRYLYDGKTATDIFEEEGFKASESLTMVEGENRTISVTLPSLIDKADAEISFKSGDTATATVDTTGKVTGVKAGSTEITTTVKVGETTKIAKTAVTVTAGDNIKQGIAAEYDLSGLEEGKLKDTSGRGNDATAVGESGITFADGVMTMASNDSYFKLPASIMDSLTDKEAFTIETTFAKSSACGNNAWLFCLGSDVKSTGTNYMFLSPNFEGKTLRAAIKDNSKEKLFATAIQPKKDQFYTVNMVFDHGTVKLYWDGVMVKGTDGDKIDSGFSIMDDVVTPGTTDDSTVLGYIGKSCWAPDKNYQGKISSFKIYDKAMTDEDVQLSKPEYQENFAKNLETVTEESILGKNTSLSEVSYNLSLPSAVNEIPITWTSSSEVVTSAGTVKNGAEDEIVTLKASIKSGALTAETSFELTVKALNKTALETLVPELQKACEVPYYTSQTKAALQAAMAKVDTVEGQTAVDALAAQIESILKNAKYDPVYVDPFSVITCTANCEIKPGAAAKFLQIPANAAEMVTVTYKSDDPAIATVAADGTITGVSRGYVRVTAAVTAKSDNFTMEYQTLVKVDEVKVVEQIVQVPAASINIKGVTAAAEKTALAKGSSTKINVTLPDDVKNANPAVTYRATGAVSVDTAGKVTGKKAGKGTVMVKVKAGNKSITKKVIVNVGEITGASSVKVNKSITLKVKGLSGKVKWSVNKSKYAKIDSKGKLKAKKKGKVVVSAKVNNVTIKKTIKIKK